MHKNVSDIRDTLVKKWVDGDFVTDKTGCKTVEIVGSSFIANEEFIIREPNYEYIEREIEWYVSESLSVAAIEGKTPKIWNDVADSKGNINSNYGYLVYSKENYDQFTNVLNELLSNPDSRRANMIYTRPSMHYDYNRDGMSDFICTNNVQYLIRDKKVHAVVNMRSNDAVFGYNNDFAWQEYVLCDLVDCLNLHKNDYSKGDIYWQSGSLHVYERHFNYLEELSKHL